MLANSGSIVSLGGAPNSFGYAQMPRSGMVVDSAYDGWLVQSSEHTLSTARLPAFRGNRSSGEYAGIIFPALRCGWGNHLVFRGPDGAAGNIRGSAGRG